MCNSLGNEIIKYLSVSDLKNNIKTNNLFFVNFIFKLHYFIVFSFCKHTQHKNNLAMLSNILTF